MTNFHLLVVEIADPSLILLSHPIDNQILKSVSEKEPGILRPHNNYYYVIGSNTMSPSITFNDVNQAVTFSGQLGLPYDDDKSYAIILLHFPKKDEARKAREVLQLIPARDGFKHSMIGDDQRFYIKKYLQDMMIYGGPCDSDICDEFTSMIPHFKPIVVSDEYIPIPMPLNEQNKPYKSINRCSNSLNPM